MKKPSKTDCVGKYKNYRNTNFHAFIRINMHTTVSSVMGENLGYQIMHNDPWGLQIPHSMMSQI